MPTVVNRHHHRGTWPAHAYYVGRPGPVAREEIARGAIDATRFGKPFTPQKHGQDAIQLYRRHPWNAMKDFPEHARALLVLPPTALLICSCQPRPCHATEIARAWEFLFSKHRRRNQLVRLTRFLATEIAEP